MLSSKYHAEKRLLVSSDGPPDTSPKPNGGKVMQIKLASGAVIKLSRQQQQKVHEFVLDMLGVSGRVVHKVRRKTHTKWTPMDINTLTTAYASKNGGTISDFAQSVSNMLGKTPVAVRSKVGYLRRIGRIS